jgi:hypothetical protein
MEQHLSSVIRGDISVSPQRNICSALICSVQAGIHSKQLRTIAARDGLSSLTWRLAGRQTETDFIISLLHIYSCQIFLRIHTSLLLCIVVQWWQAIDIQMRNLCYILNMDIWMIIKSIEAKPGQSPLNNGWEVDVTQFVRCRTSVTPPRASSPRSCHYLLLFISLGITQ